MSLSLSFLPKWSSSGSSDVDNPPSGSKSRSSLTDPSPQSEVSNNSWQDGNPLISAPLSALLLGRTALYPTPPPVAGPSRSTKIYKHSSLQISSTQSLKYDPRIRVVSVSDDGYFGTGNKQLSPIVEQDYFSPETQQLSLPLEQTAEQQITTSNGSEHSDTPRHSPVYPTFINRPLNRSISQVSQTTLRTHRSNVSTPPCIPPLDLRPTFHNSLDSPPLLTPPIPGAVTEPSNEHPGAFNSETSSLHADSFISARSAAPIQNGKHVDQDPYSQAEQGDIVRSNTTHSSQSSSSSYIARRWATSLSFGSDLLLFSKAWKEPLSQKRPTVACLLFGLGFFAPWCWMIGGWMLTESGQTKAEGHGGHVQPFGLLWSSEKNTEKGIEGGKGEKEKAGGAPSTCQGYGFARGYPFIVPSVESLTSSAKVLRMKPTAATKTLDPWVLRCRIAAVTSGILLLIALVVAIVVVGRHR